MGLFSKIGAWFKGGNKEEDFEVEGDSDIDLSFDEGVEDDFMNEVNNDYNGEEGTVEATSSDETKSYNEYDGQTNETTDEQNQVDVNNDYSQQVEQTYNSDFDNNTNYSPQSNNTFEIDQNLTQPNEEIFVEIQNRIKMIREKTEELKRLRQENQSTQQETVE